MHWRSWIKRSAEKRLKTLGDIQSEFSEQLQPEKDKQALEIEKAEAELNVLLERAGIGLFRTDDSVADASHQIADLRERISLIMGPPNDEDYYRLQRQVRERVFGVPDVQLRKDIMAAVNRLRHAWWSRAWTFSILGDSFIARLSHERCEVPQPSASFASCVALLVILYWFGGSSFSMISIGIVLLLASFLIVQHITALQRHDVTIQEGIAYVKRNTAEFKRDEKRLLHLPSIFSSREIVTGEPDA